MRQLKNSVYLREQLVLTNFQKRSAIENKNWHGKQPSMPGVQQVLLHPVCRQRPKELVDGVGLAYVFPVSKRFPCLATEAITCPYGERMPYHKTPNPIVRRLLLLQCKNMNKKPLICVYLFIRRTDIIKRAVIFRLNKNVPIL